jgi:thiamine transport system permease protein
MWALENTVLQAFLSGLLAVLFGFFLALGWGHFRSIANPFWQKITEWLLLAPAFLPPIFILLIGFSVVTSIPRGIFGIALFHGFMNAGLLAIGFEKVFRSQLAGLSDMSYVLGVSKYLFWRKSFALIRKDLLYAFLFVFAMAISSFSIPLMIGGGDGTTLEVLIFEKIRISNAWDEALFLALLQWGLIFAVSFFPNWGKALGRSSAKMGSPLLRSGLWAMVVLICTFGFAISYFYFSLGGWVRVLNMDGLLALALSRSATSAFLMAGAYTLFYFSFYFLARHFSDRRLRQGLNQFLAPSSSLVAFALLFFVQDSKLKLIGFLLGCFWLFFPVIYKLRWSARLSELDSQIQMAQLMGADDALTFNWIVWPQVQDVVHLLALVGCVFVAGDFAFSKIFLDGHETLALLVESLMSSYRTEAGIALSFGLILLPLIVSSILKPLLSGVLKRCQPS